MSRAFLGMMGKVINDFSPSFSRPAAIGTGGNPVQCESRLSTGDLTNNGHLLAEINFSVGATNLSRIFYYT